jgi:hypothetical protein
MALSTINKICDDCVSLFKDAASILSSGSSEKLSTIFTTDYQSRLTANVSLAGCHMCALIAENISWGLKPLDHTERLELTILKAGDHEDAAILDLIGYEIKPENGRRFYPGRLRIQDGQQ